MSARIAIAALAMWALAAASTRATAAPEACPKQNDPAAGPLAGGAGPADFGAVPEACGATDVSLRLRGALDRAALARALDGIVARHEALRTTFTEVDGAPEQRIAPAEVGFHLVELDLAGRSGLPCIGAERADMVVAGCAILEAILDIWPAERLGIADRGIREGILRSLMARDGHVL